MQNPKLGLKENWKQFLLLIFINALVGGMVGLERTILPELALQDFGLSANSAILSFIVVFGISKAVTNYFMGSLANRWGRKNLLVLGWIVAIPIPFLFIYAPNWNWIIAANVLLGINQGLAWSSTVVMKIDLVGEKHRGLAMGLNESSGYLAVALFAFLSSYVANNFNLRPEPFYLAFGLIALGLLSSIFFVRDTRKYAQQEAQNNLVPRLKNIFWETTWKNPTLSSISQAGLVNNLNDGMVWGIFPILLAQKGFALNQIGVIVAVYPAVWGIGQLLTGKMADFRNKKKMLFGGMLLQGMALLGLLWMHSYFQLILLSALMGWGTALVYPTFLVTIAENTHPKDRAASIGVFRLWRDLGYAIGALLTGIIADLFSLDAALVFIGALTLLSAVVLQRRMP